MAGHSDHSRGIISGINVTPLVDITLVLLIIFIVTAKIVVAPAVPLDLPEASQSSEVQVIFSVLMDRDGPVRVNGTAVASDAVVYERARQAVKDNAELRAVIQAGRDVPHGRVIALLDTLKRAGISRVAFGAVPSEAAP